MQFVDFFCVFALGIGFGFVVCLGLQSALVFLRFGGMLFVPFVSGSVQAGWNVGLDSFDVILFDELMVYFLKFFPGTAIL